ncbi:hypothetical protein Tco_1180992 [Tanacetum coccineum]
MGARVAMGQLDIDSRTSMVLPLGLKPSFQILYFNMKNRDQVRSDVVELSSIRTRLEESQAVYYGRPGSRMIQWLPPPSQAEDEPPVKKRHVS